MQAEIITIGDEILIGQIVDTNSAFIARSLNAIGIGVYQITSIQDEKDQLLKTFEEAEGRADVIIITGGLGPTKDDITKKTLCEYFDDDLIRDPDVLKNIELLFKKYIETPISDLNRDQALVPSKAQVLMNRFGTAPGMWLEKNGKVFISLPGVPYEMKALIDHKVIPLLKEKFHKSHIVHRTLLTYGLGESALAERIEAWEDTLPAGIKLAYLPNLGKVRLRLTGKGDDKEAIENEINRRFEMLHPLIGEYIVGFEDEGELEEIIGDLLLKAGMTIATAESCTGGKLAGLITSVPGASSWFKGSVVSYATEVKENVLGIPHEMIEEHSVVSAAVAEAMAVNVRKLMNTDFALSTTGNAGPSKGESDEDVGTVFIALATKGEVIVEKFNFGNHRSKVVNRAIHKALEMLKKEILKK
ncbi:competence/damage-inducible protein A [Robertkochia solimangrovi]|uniref:competence/damage-inducible protein A n=1 Tax=Robertkochia solimangrovi TaxID=2213046 RepID=UPI00117E88EA|nr:competence/damage-inducible protein A [Robertkochia solimangrovi]TRZ41806.1 competence/damage-inducible protein A [Robertkochia solimangrovi]